MAWALAVSVLPSEAILKALRAAGQEATARAAEFRCAELVGVAWSLAAVRLAPQGGHVARLAAEAALSKGQGLVARSLWCLARLQVSSPLRLGAVRAPFLEGKRPETTTFGCISEHEEVSNGLRGMHFSAKTGALFRANEVPPAGGPPWPQPRGARPLQQPLGAGAAPQQRPFAPGAPGGAPLPGPAAVRGLRLGPGHGALRLRALAAEPRAVPQRRAGRVRLGAGDL